MDIAATVNPATVHFRSLTEPARLSILEQNYEYDLLEPDKLLRKYVGRDVMLDAHASGRRTTREEEVKAQAPQLQQCAGLADWQRDRDRSSRRPHPVPGTARTTSTRDRRSSGRSTTRAPRVTGSRRRIWRRSSIGAPTTCLTVARDDKVGRYRRLGHADQRQRHGVPQCETAARGRRSQSRARR